MATEDLTRALDEAGARYELLPHARTESAAAEAEALGIASAAVAKTLVVTTPEGYVRAVLPASERIDLRKLREVRGGGKKQVHLASEEHLARDYPEFDLGAVPPIGGGRHDPVVVDRVRGRPSRARQVADAGAWLGEGLEPVRFDASPELRQGSPHETEMERTDDGLVGHRHLLEGTALQHELPPPLRSPELGPETVLLVETNDLVDRLLPRGRRKRWRLADEVPAPRPSSLLGASAGVAL